MFRMTEFGSNGGKTMADYLHKMDAMLFCASLSDYDVFADDKTNEVGSSRVELMISG